VALRRTERNRIWPTALREALLIGGASVALAAAVWLARSDRLPLRAQAEVYELELAAPVVTVAEAVALFTAGTHLFVDVREDPAGAGIPGAFRVRTTSFDADVAEARDFLFPEAKLVVYDEGAMQLAGAAAAHFQERGFANVAILQGGLAAWQAGGGQLSGGADHAP
jgi:rhodanese-related sulfurtransferase